MFDDDLDDIADQNDLHANVGDRKDGRGRKRGKKVGFNVKRDWRRELRRAQKISLIARKKRGQS